jgi:hypothetical protein
MFKLDMTHSLTKTTKGVITHIRDSVKQGEWWEEYAMDPFDEALVAEIETLPSAESNGVELKDRLRLCYQVIVTKDRAKLFREGSLVEGDVVEMSIYSFFEEPTIMDQALFLKGNKLVERGYCQEVTLISKGKDPLEAGKPLMSSVPDQERLLKQSKTRKAQNVPEEVSFEDSARNLVDEAKLGSYSTMTFSDLLRAIKEKELFTQPMWGPEDVEG